MLRARTTIVLGALACHELLPAGAARMDRSPDEVLRLICDHVDRRCVWGDSTFPYIFFTIKFLEARGEKVRAERLLVELFTVLVETNYQQKGPVFPSPYLGVEEILAASIPDRLQDANFEGYRGSSYILRSVLEMLVRRGRRDIVLRVANGGWDERFGLRQSDPELGCARFRMSRRFRHSAPVSGPATHFKIPHLGLSSSRDTGSNSHARHGRLMIV